MPRSTETDFKREIGRNIAEARKRRQFSQKTLAERLGCSADHLGQIELGRSSRSLPRCLTSSMFHFVICLTKLHNQTQPISGALSWNSKAALYWASSVTRSWRSLLNSFLPWRSATRGEVRAKNKPVPMRGMN